MQCDFHILQNQHKKLNKNCQKNSEKYERKTSNFLCCCFLAAKATLCKRKNFCFFLFFVILFSKHPSKQFFFCFCLCFSFFCIFFSSLKQHSIKKNRADFVLKLQLVKRFIKKSWKQKSLFSSSSYYFPFHHKSIIYQQFSIIAHLRRVYRVFYKQISSSTLSAQYFTSRKTFFLFININFPTFFDIRFSFLLFIVFQ